MSMIEENDKDEFLKQLDVCLAGAVMGISSQIKMTLQDDKGKKFIVLLNITPVVKEGNT